MAVGTMLISPDTEHKLGEPGVAEVAGWLWPVDCQTCGRALGSRPPALCVDDMTEFAAASLHHETCRAPEWKLGPFTGHGGDLVTHRTRLIRLPTSGGNGPRAIPVMLVNPAMELVILERSDGAWHPEFNAAFTHAGMAPPGPELLLYQPIRGAAARLTRTAVTITMPRPSLTDDYECRLATDDEPFAREITAQGGIMLAISQAVDPFARDLTQQFISVLSDGRMLWGWVPLTGK
jgi:hypothetical protein